MFLLLKFCTAIIQDSRWFIVINTTIMKFLNNLNNLKIYIFFKFVNQLPITNDKNMFSLKDPVRQSVVTKAVQVRL